MQGRLISQKAGCVCVCNSALPKVCLCIRLSRLQQRSLLETTCGGRTGVCFKVYVFDKLRIKYWVNLSKSRSYVGNQLWHELVWFVRVEERGCDTWEERGRQKEDLCLRMKDRWEECCNMSLCFIIARLKVVLNGESWYNPIYVFMSFLRKALLAWPVCSGTIIYCNNITNNI